MKRLYQLDNIKIWLIIFVVIFHCLVPYTKATDAIWTKVVWSFIMTYTMPLFFAISGFFYKKRTIKDNFVKYLYPCIVFSILLYAWGYFFYPPYKNGLSVGITGYAMWFLIALFIYQIVLSCIDSLMIMTNKLITLLLLMSIIISLIAGAIPYIGPLFQSSRIIGHFPFFLFGILIKRIGWLERINNKVWCSLATISTFSIFLFCNLRFNLLGGTSFYSGYGNSLLIGGGKRLLIYIFDLLIILGSITLAPNKNYWFTKYGSRTMNVYLLHMFVIFPFCYKLFSDYMFLPIGYFLYLVLTPSFCMIFFNKRIATAMDKLLMLPQKK